MKKGDDISVQVDGLIIIHQNLPGLWVREHKHPHYELFIPLAGNIKIKQQNQEWVVSPQHMLWLPTNTSHSFESESERLILMFENKYWQQNNGVECSCRQLPALQLLKEVAFYVLLHPKNKSNKIFANAMVSFISEQINDNATSPDNALLNTNIDKRVQSALQILQTEFIEDISINDLAEKIGTSPRTLLRLFTQNLNSSPKQVLIKYRIQEACRLLKTTNLSITDVAFESGFGAVSNFISCFRNQIGKLPSDYRDLYKKSHTSCEKQSNIHN